MLTHRVVAIAHRMVAIVIAHKMVAIVVALLSQGGLARDFGDIQKEGVLRVIKPPILYDYLPRVGTGPDTESLLIERFAKENQLGIKYIYAMDTGDCFKLLEKQLGDIIVANLVVTEDRAQRAAFTKAIYTIDEFLVSSVSRQTSLANDLYGKTIHIFQGSHHEETANVLARQVKGLKIAYILPLTTMDQVYSNIGKKHIDFTIQDGNKLISDLKYRNDIKQSYQLSSQKPVAWAVNKKKPALLKRLNDFIAEKVHPKQIATDSIVDKTIRFGIMNDIYSYYIAEGELRGFHYDFLKEFVKAYHIKHTLIIAENRYQMIEMLKNNEIDVAVGFYPFNTLHMQGVAFTKPFHHSTERVVTGSKDTTLTKLAFLSGRYITIAKGSKYIQTTEKLIKDNHKIRRLFVPASVTDLALVEGVGKGIYDLTLADSYIIDIEKMFNDTIVSPLAVSPEIPHGWLVSSKKDKLLAKLNAFIDKQYKSQYFNVLYRKYFKNYAYIGKEKASHQRLLSSGRLSPYDELVRQYAQEFGFNWKLLVAQMYQESRFDPSAKSSRGALGLFQLLAKTANQLGYQDIQINENNIKAGIHYMSWIREQLKGHVIRDQDRIWFILAAYNAGIGHIRDAISLARKKNWKTDRWFDGVEDALLLLSQKAYAKKSRYGYVRGSETVNYVHAIKERFEAYATVDVDLQK